jgi:hypothetical protein
LAAEPCFDARMRALRRSTYRPQKAVFSSESPERKPKKPRGI